MAAFDHVELYVGVMVIHWTVRIETKPRKQPQARPEAFFKDSIASTVDEGGKDYVCLSYFHGAL